MDNLLITAEPVKPGEKDTAFVGIEEIPPKSENVYGKTYIDTDFENGIPEGLTDLGEKTALYDKTAWVTGRLASGNSAWSNYSVEMDFCLKDKQIINSTEPYFKFRCQNEFNYYSLRTNTAGSSIQIYKSVNGSETWVGQTVLYMPENIKKMRLDVFGDTIRIYFRNTSYPDFEYPALVLNDSSVACGGIEICKPSYVSRIEIDKLIIREIKELGNIGPRPEPEHFVNFTNPAYKDWTDIENHWAFEYLKYMSNIGAVCGYPDNTFRPDEFLNVNEALKILCKAKNIETAPAEENWASPYINAAKNNGWFEENTFDSFERPIYRRELLNIVEKSSNGDIPAQNLIQGDENGNLNLDKPVTRAQAAVIIARSLSEVFVPCENTKFVSFEEYPLAFANPYKGFRNIVGEPYVTTVKIDFKWNEIESSANDGIEKIIAAANEKMIGLPENNTKAVIGVILEFPPNKYWPGDMTAGDYTSEQFKERLKKMIEKLGAAFDNDPRVAFIKMKIIGKWGEMQDPAPTPEVAGIMSEYYHKYFKNKKVLTNIGPHISMFREYDFGTHWDSFAHWGNILFLEYFETDYYKEIWKAQMMIGETAFDWGEPLGKSPNDAVINHKDRLIEIIRGTHCSSISWLSRYDKKDPETTAAAVDIQKVLGYRYVLQNARYTLNAAPGEKFNIVFTLANTGSAPMYYDEPLEFSLLDLNTHEVVWKTILDDVDIRSWLPDGDYSCTPVYTISESFDLPDDLKDGIYTAALSILDSEGGNLPSIRFANTNYYKGGRTPLGNILVGSEQEIPELDKSEFADLFTDKLHYIYSPEN